MTYSDKLKHPKWQKKRLKILERDNWKCKYCDDGENQLQIHHLKYTVKEPHDEPDENLITVCENCHQVLEILKKETSFDIQKNYKINLEKLGL